MDPKDDGPASAYKLPQVKQIDRSQIVQDICNLIEVMPLTKELIEQLYEAICERKARGD